LYVSSGDLGRDLSVSLDAAGVLRPAATTSGHDRLPGVRRRPGQERPGQQRAGQERAAVPAERPAPCVRWRLIGANNRELGRSAAAYDGLAACRDAVVRLREGIGRAHGVLTMSDGNGTWTWRLELDGGEAALSGRTYQRQREAQHNLSLFLAAVPLARIDAAVPNRPRLRGPRHPGGPGKSREDADPQPSPAGPAAVVAVPLAVVRQP
jgi:hypothetical protein